jgi:hypothetical protein
LTLEDVKIDRIDDGWTHQAYNLLHRAAGLSLPQTLSLDLLNVLHPAKLPGSDFTVEVASLGITQITTRRDSVTVQFDVHLKVQ